jgi:hypothetical protein
LRGSSSPAKKRGRTQDLVVLAQPPVLRPQPFDLDLLVALAPGRSPASMSACTSQRRTVSRPTPSLPATALANAASDG